MYLVLPLLVLVLVIGALADIITADQWRIRHLDKVFWIIIVILLPLIGSILWFAVGRDYSHPVDRGGFGDPRRREADAADPLAPAPGASGAVARNAFAPRNTEAELAALEREIVANEKADRVRRLEAELRARREAEGTEGSN